MKHKVVNIVRGLVDEEKAWVQKCIDVKESLDKQEQEEFKEIFKVMTETPFSQEDIEFLATIGDEDTLDEAYELHKLRIKWSDFMGEGDLPSVYKEGS